MEEYKTTFADLPLHDQKDWRWPTARTWAGKFRRATAVPIGVTEPQHCALKDLLVSCAKIRKQVLDRIAADCLGWPDKKWPAGYHMRLMGDVKIALDNVGLIPESVGYDARLRCAAKAIDDARQALRAGKTFPASPPDGTAPAALAMRLPWGCYRAAAQVVLTQERWLAMPELGWVQVSDPAALPLNCAECAYVELGHWGRQWMLRLVFFEKNPAYAASQGGRAVRL